MAGQFLPDGHTDGRGTQRLFSSASLTVLYTGPTNPLNGDFTQPTIATVNASVTGPTTTFLVQTTDPRTTVKVVEVLYTDAESPGTWTPLALTSTNGLTWAGHGAATNSGQLDYVVQAVDSAGNVTVASNKASNFPATEVPQPVTVTVSGSQTYGSHNPSFHYTTTPPDAPVTGSVSCTKVVPGATISATLQASVYTLAGTSCSGLSTTANYASHLPRILHRHKSDAHRHAEVHDTPLRDLQSVLHIHHQWVREHRLHNSGEREGIVLQLGDDKERGGDIPDHMHRRGLSATNYTFAFARGIVKVTPATLTVTPKSATKLYGAGIPTLSYTVTGFVATDGLSVVSGKAACLTLASSTSPVGTYAITCTQGTLSAHNYIFHMKAGAGGGTAMLKVTPATLTVTAKSATKGLGAALPTLSYTVTGFVAGNPPSVVTGKAKCTTTATKTSAPGTYPITCTKGTLAAPNYTFTFKPGTLTVSGGVLPSLKSLSRTSGPTTGGTSVTVTGTLFTTVANVKLAQRRPRRLRSSPPPNSWSPPRPTLRARSGSR